MPRALESLQALLCRLITAPDGVASALAHEHRLPRGGLGAVIGGDARMTPHERLDVYANMYFYRLLEVLRKDYPATAAALGTDHFHNVVTGYLLEYPPSEPSIFYAGQYLPRYLRSHPLRREFPYAAELAALERAISEVFCARDGLALDAAAMRTIALARWPRIRMRAVPALEVLRTRWRVTQSLRRFETRRLWRPPARSDSIILVWRRDLKVFYRELDPVEARGIAALRRGASFGEICSVIAAAAISDDDFGAASDPAATINTMLARWLRDGIVAGATPVKKKAAARVRY